MEHRIVRFWWLTLGALALWSCGGRTQLDRLEESGPGADGGAAGSDAAALDASNLEVLLTEFPIAKFSFCRCHHGLGPGADGEVSFRATNRGTRTVDLSVESIELIGRTDGRRISAPPNGWVRLERADRSTFPGRIEAGQGLSLVITAYLDLQGIGAMEPLPVGNYQILAVLRSGGARFNLSFLAIDIQARTR